VEGDAPLGHETAHESLADVEVVGSLGERQRRLGSACRPCVSPTVSSARAIVAFRPHGLFPSREPLVSGFYLFPVVGGKRLSTALIASPEKPRRRVAGVDDHFLTVEQVADLLHVSTKTVFNMTRDGRLPARRLPGSRRYLYVRQEILDLLDQTRSGPTEVQEAEVDAET
jgi:excisionase family DNA binding protein